MNKNKLKEITLCLRKSLSGAAEALDNLNDPDGVDLGPLQEALDNAGDSLTDLEAELEVPCEGEPADAPAPEETDKPAPPAQSNIVVE